MITQFYIVCITLSEKLLVFFELHKKLVKILLFQNIAVIFV